MVTFIKLAVLAAALSVSSIHAHAATVKVGDLEWDGVSPTFRNIQTGIEYINFGLAGTVKESERESFLQDFSGFEIATYDQFNDFWQAGTGIPFVCHGIFGNCNIDFTGSSNVTATPDLTHPFGATNRLVTIDYFDSQSLLLRSTSALQFSTDGIGDGLFERFNTGNFYVFTNASSTVSPVPESSTFMLVGLGMLGIFGFNYRNIHS